VLVVVVIPIGCLGGGGGGGSIGISTTGVVTVSAGSAGRNISLTDGVPTQVVKTLNYNVGRFGGPYEALTIDLSAHIPWIDVTPVPRPLSADGTAGKASSRAGGNMSIRIAREEQADTVCTDGELYGPFYVTIDDATSQVNGVEPASTTASQASVDIINSGSLVVCVIVIPEVTASVDLDSVSFDLDQCTTPPVNMAGTWQGDYSCSGSCPEAGTVTLAITQDPSDMSFASYSDGTGANYEGTVCGNRFSYTGGVAGVYEESGTFILDTTTGIGSKTSSYESVDGSDCYGTCSDPALVRN
jgi:hypothetical protein